MDKLSIETSLSYVHTESIYGSYNERPLSLIVQVTNNTVQPIQIAKICVSTKGLLLSKEALAQCSTQIIQPNEQCNFYLNTIHLIRKFERHTVFTVKLTSINNEVFESKQISIASLNELHNELYEA